MVELTGGAIVVQHRPHIFFRESSQFIKLRRSGIVRTYIETARQVVHCHGTDTRHETTLDGRIRSCLDGIEKRTEITCAVRFLHIVIQAFRFGKNLIGEMVVLIDEKEYLLIGISYPLTQEIQLFDCPLLFIHLLFQTLGQIISIYITEPAKSGIAMRIQRIPVIVQASIYYRKIQIKNQIGIPFGSRVLADIQVTVQFLELILL